MFLKAAFDPKIEWVFPEEKFLIHLMMHQLEQNILIYKKSKKLWHFIKGADNITKQAQKENMFFQMLEGLHESEAKLLVNAKDKKLHQIYKGLSANVVREAFGWDENFVVPAPEVYPHSLTDNESYTNL